MAALYYLPKRGLGIAFGSYFLRDFSIKCSLFNTLPTDKVLMLYLFSFSRYQTKCVSESLF